MAVLNETERAGLWALLMEAGLIPPGVLKADIRAAVDATDDFIENNGATINSALPQPYRGAASASQKAILFGLVAMRRGGATAAQMRSIIRTLGGS